MTLEEVKALFERDSLVIRHLKQERKALRRILQLVDEESDSFDEIRTIAEDKIKECNNMIRNLIFADALLENTVLIRDLGN